MNATAEQISFIDSLDGNIPSPEQAAQLLELSGQGDTATPIADTDGQPKVVPKTVDENLDKQPAEDELNADNAVILAKDGKHTIGFDKLVEARQTAQQYKMQAEAAQAELQRLQQEASNRAAAGIQPTPVDTQVVAAAAAIEAGADPALFGDFSEEQLSSGILKLVNSKVSEVVGAALAQSLEPIQRKHQDDAANAHYNAIYAAHPDADSMAESQELADWIAKQPSFVQDGYKAVLDSGTTNQVIELFDRFKAENNTTNNSAQPSQDDVKAKAKAIVASATSAPPVSLSDIPGGTPTGKTLEEALGDMSGPDMLERMNNMTPQQIEAVLNRSL